MLPSGRQISFNSNIWWHHGTFISHCELRPASQQSPQSCPRNSSNVTLGWTLINTDLWRWKVGCFLSPLLFPAAAILLSVFAQLEREGGGGRERGEGERKRERGGERGEREKEERGWGERGGGERGGRKRERGRERGGRERRERERLGGGGGGVLSASLPCRAVVICALLVSVSPRSPWLWHGQEVDPQ